MPTTRLAIGKYICGMVASLIIFLAGGWLILAPFALGYQPSSADWVNQTTNDFVTGIPVVVVALVGFAFFFVSLLASLRAAGVLAVRTRVQAPAPTGNLPLVVQPQATASNQSDLDRTLATLAAALAADLSSRRQSSSDQISDQSIEQSVNRRES